MNLLTAPATEVDTPILLSLLSGIQILLEFQTVTRYQKQFSDLACLLLR